MAAPGFSMMSTISTGWQRAEFWLLSDPGLHAAIAASGRRTVKERFCADLIVPRYETFYEELLR